MASETTTGDLGRTATAGSEGTVSPKVSSVGGEGQASGVNTFQSDRLDVSAPGLDSHHWAGVAKASRETDARSVGSSLAAERDAQSLYDANEPPYDPERDAGEDASQGGVPGTPSELGRNAPAPPSEPASGLDGTRSTAAASNGDLASLVTVEPSGASGSGGDSDAGSVGPSASLAAAPQLAATSPSDLGDAGGASEVAAASDLGDVADGSLLATEGAAATATDAAAGDVPAAATDAAAGDVPAAPPSSAAPVTAPSSVSAPASEYQDVLDEDEEADEADTGGGAAQAPPPEAEAEAAEGPAYLADLIGARDDEPAAEGSELVEATAAETSLEPEPAASAEPQEPELVSADEPEPAVTDEPKPTADLAETELELEAADEAVGATEAPEPEPADLAGPTAEVREEENIPVFGEGAASATVEVPTGEGQGWGGVGAATVDAATAFDAVDEVSLDAPAPAGGAEGDVASTGGSSAATPADDTPPAALPTSSLPASTELYASRDPRDPRASGRVENLEVEGPSAAGTAGTAGLPGAVTPAAPAASPPPPPPVEFNEAWEAMFKGLVHADGVDSLGRPVVVINADAVPGNMKQSAARYVVAHVTPLVERGPYVLIFTSRSSRLPGMWIMGAYTTLPRPFRKNVQWIVLVRPTGFLRAVLAILRPFVSHKANRKIRQVDSLGEIATATEGQVSATQLGPTFLATDAARAELAPAADEDSSAP